MIELKTAKRATEETHESSKMLPVSCSIFFDFTKLEREIGSRGSRKVQSHEVISKIPLFHRIQITKQEG